jgi:hypothetical protein
LSTEYTEASALRKMLGYFEVLAWRSERILAEKLLLATMSALKSTAKDVTTWHVFIQDMAAALNRAGVLSNTNVQLFREVAYAYMNAKS